MKKKLLLTVTATGVVAAVAVCYFAGVFEHPRKEAVIETATKKKPKQKQIVVDKERKKETVEKKKPEVKREEKKEAAGHELKAKTEKPVVLFKDGAVVTDSDISAEMNKLPEQLSAKMSLKDIKFFLALKAAFDKVVTSEAKKEGIDKDPAVLSEIEQKSGTIAGVMLLNDMANEMMTDVALEKHYDDVWEKNFKGTKEFSLKVVTTPDKSLAAKFQRIVKDRKTLDRLIESNKANVKSMDLDNRAEAMLPPEITEQVKTAGEGSIIGPFNVKGSYMLFFVKKVAMAKKHEFSGKFKEGYKKIATKDFVKKVNEKLYRENKVKFIGLDGKEIDMDKHDELTKTRASERSAPSGQFDLGGIKDATVFGYIGQQKITATDIKKFFKLKTLQDEALVSMAQQFNMSLKDIIVYATKLVIDDRLLALAAKKRKYSEKYEVKEKLDELKKIEITNAYLKRHADVTPEKVRKTYNTFISTIPDEDKNDREISTKIVLFESSEEAEDALDSIRSGRTRFNDLFQSKLGSDGHAIDLKYVTKRSVDARLWSDLKKSSSGACCKEVVEVDGSGLGVPGMNYAVVYVGDKRPVTLPSLSNPGDKKYFETMAYQSTVAKFVSDLLVKKVETMCGKEIADVVNDPAFSKMLEAMVAGSAAS